MEDIAKWALNTSVIYSNYCKDAAKQRFQNDLVIFVNSIESFQENYVICKKQAFTLAGEIMKKLKSNSSWDELRLYCADKFDNIDVTLLTCNMLLEYSEFGTAFMEEVIDMGVFMEIANLVKKYEDKKAYQIINREL